MSEKTCLNFFLSYYEVFSSVQTHKSNRKKNPHTLGSPCFKITIIEVKSVCEFIGETQCHVCFYVIFRWLHLGVKPLPSCSMTSTLSCLRRTRASSHLPHVPRCLSPTKCTSTWASPSFSSVLQVGSFIS